MRHRVLVVVSNNLSNIAPPHPRSNRRWLINSSRPALAGAADRRRAALDRRLGMQASMAFGSTAQSFIRHALFGAHLAVRTLLTGACCVPFDQPQFGNSLNPRPLRIIGTQFSARAALVFACFAPETRKMYDFLLPAVRASNVAFSSGAAF